jgi:CxxC-x17-CxxC domain-containing protein
MQTSSEAPPMDDAPDFDEGQLASEPMPADDAFAGLEETAPATPGEKLKVEGDWKCSGCGAAITSLPFEPRGNANLKCLDCFKASKA